MTNYNNFLLNLIAVGRAAVTIIDHNGEAQVTLLNDDNSTKDYFVELNKMPKQYAHVFRASEMQYNGNYDASIESLVERNYIGAPIVKGGNSAIYSNK